MIQNSLDDFNLKLNLNKFRSILCLSGTLPKRSFFKNATLPIIACDGAANFLHAQKVPIYKIIGDLDSVDPALKSKYSCIEIHDQNNCDFEKAVDYLHNVNLLPTVILGMQGGYVDHTLNNISIFVNTPYLKDSIFVDYPIFGQILDSTRNDKYIIQTPLNSKISIIGAPHAVVSTKGLFWNLNNNSVTFPNFGSCSYCFNRSIANNVEVLLHQGAIILMQYIIDIKDAAYAIAANTKSHN